MNATLRPNPIIRRRSAQLEAISTGSAAPHAIFRGKHRRSGVGLCRSRRELSKGIQTPAPPALGPRSKPSTAQARSWRRRPASENGKNEKPPLREVLCRHLNQVRLTSLARYVLTKESCASARKENSM